ncbi:MAG: hypothetical protein L6Q76_28920, partial [Polyangiaceae bacterium]|nr:hypothetical protein [Polyangiaceae bacterium]
NIAADAFGFKTAYHGLDYNPYFAAFSGGLWAPTSEPVGNFGPFAGDIANTATGSTLVFARGLANELVARDRVAGVWLAEQVIATSAGFDFNISPELVALPAGPELMVVFVAPGGQIRFATRAGGVWSATAAVPFATTADRVALTVLAGGNVALAFRGMNGSLYASLFTGGMWVGPVLVTANVMSTPSIAPGIGSADGELAYIGTDGNVYHSRLISNAFTPPVIVGGPNLVGVAIATSP